MADSNQGPLEGFYSEKNKILVIVLSVLPCIACIMFILNLIALLTSKSESSKGVAKFGLIANAIFVVVSFILNLAFGGLAMIQGAR